MKQQVLGETIKHDKKVVVNVVFGLDCNGERDFMVSEENNMCSAHSSGGDFNEPNLKEGLKKCLTWYCSDYLEEGYTKENIIIKEREMTKEELDDWIKMREDEKIRDTKSLTKEIAKLKSELMNKMKKLIKTKQKDFTKYDK